MLLGSRRDTRTLGTRIARALGPGSLVVVSGPLGAGKTFLVRAIARALGVTEDTAITSPTFNLVAEYEVACGALVHADLYRLRDGENARADILRLGLRERRAEGAILVVEWASGFERELGGAPDLDLAIEVTGENTREVTMTGSLASQVIA